MCSHRDGGGVEREGDVSLALEEKKQKEATVGGLGDKMVAQVAMAIADGRSSSPL